MSASVHASVFKNCKQEVIELRRKLRKTQETLRNIRFDLFALSRDFLDKRYIRENNIHDLVAYQLSAILEKNKNKRKKRRSKS